MLSKEFAMTIECYFWPSGHKASAGKYIYFIIFVKGV